MRHLVHRTVRVVSTILVAVILVGELVSGHVQAELDPAAQQQIEPAVVEVALWLTGVKDGQLTEETRARGSGTVISADGLILTNAHVVTLDGLDEHLAAEAEQAARQGSTLSLAPAADLNGIPYYRILIPDQSGDPVPEYTAQVVATDVALDLAVLRVVGDAHGVPLGDHPLPMAPVVLGDSDLVKRAQPVHIFGYPAGLGLLYTEGAVSGFQSQPGVVGRAWMFTTANVAPGNSGGAAVDDAGRLIGIPTAVLPPECRPDTADEGAACQAAGDPITQLRPINLVKPLLRDIAPELGAPAQTQPASSSTPPPATGAAASPAPAADDAAPLATSPPELPATPASTPAAPSTCETTAYLDGLPVVTLDTPVSVVNIAGSNIGQERTLPAGSMVKLNHSPNRIYGKTEWMWLATDLAETDAFWLANQYVHVPFFNPGNLECANGSIVSIDGSAPAALEPGSPGPETFDEDFEIDEMGVAFIDGAPVTLSGATWWPVKIPESSQRYWVQEQNIGSAIVLAYGGAPPPLPDFSPTADIRSLRTWPPSARLKPGAVLYGSSYTDAGRWEYIPLGTVDAETPVLMLHGESLDASNLYWRVSIPATGVEASVRDADLDYPHFDPAKPRLNMGTYAIVPDLASIRRGPTQDPVSWYDDGFDPEGRLPVIINGPPVTGLDGNTWWPVRRASVSRGGTGYVLEQDLRPAWTTLPGTPELSVLPLAPGTPAPTATPASG